MLVSAREYATLFTTPAHVVVSRPSYSHAHTLFLDVRSKKQDMTGEQMQKLEEVRAQSKEQDMILDEMSKGLDELQELAEKMQDELQLQDKMLSDLDAKTEKTQGKVDKINDRMKDALAKMNDKASNTCVYLICVVLLLGIISVAYNMATTAQQPKK